MSKQASKDKSGPKLSVTKIRSDIGALPKQRASLTGLGLKKMNQTRILEDTPAVRGMINKVHHLVKVEEVKS